MPSIPHQVEGLLREQQHMGKRQQCPCPKNHKRVSQAPPPSEDKRATPLPPSFITIPSPFSLHFHPGPATVPLPLSPLLVEPTLPFNYMLSTEFFRSLFHLHPWSTHKFHKFNPRWKHHYATFEHSLLHWYFCEKECCVYHDR